ncbi:MAG: isoprenylcysteine carboxylmethyltransferase family protein [Rhizobiales bacterium]|nr:isoprenylcysteine carboxylmethyltransferase family protein [Hyphomicrobiales bacterium]
MPAHPDPGQRPSFIPWPPMLLVLLIAAALVMDRLWPISFAAGGAAGDALAVLGGLTLIGALSLDAWAIWTMFRARTNILPHRAADRLVTTGPFAWSRNPIYLANTALIGGLGLLLGNGWMMPAMVANALLVQHLAIRPEERHLEARFGAEWRSYRERVGRWLGRRA